nr:GrpB family protein [Microbacterium endophyticum]
MIGGVEPRAIVIVDPDPAWPERFVLEHARISTALGTRARRIDHIGSTSVPGLPAKPIIDIDVSVADVEDERDYVPALVAAGYVLRVREPGHRMLRTPNLDAHVHICTAGSEWEENHLLFRDWLRQHPADRDAYAVLKRQLATRDWADMNQYSDAKTSFITEILVRARS